jgi:hypothetical protein
MFILFFIYYVDQVQEDPCIPYHTLLLRDLHTIENSKKRLSDGI